VDSEPEGLSPGLEATVDATVTEEMTAERVGSGDVPVLATPAVVALVEQAAVRALEGHLPDGRTSVGFFVTLEHMAPTPVGAAVAATARLETVEGRTLGFVFDVRDTRDLVARGLHRRVVVDRDAFLRSAAARQGA